MENRERPRRPKTKPVTHKVVVTETVTAEVVTEEECPCPQEPPSRFEAPPGIDLELLGMAPGHSLGAGILGLFHSAALAAFDAANIQNQADTLLEASTVQGVTRLYQKPGRPKS
jgi:hypothetical protein